MSSNLSGLLTIHMLQVSYLIFKKSYVGRNQDGSKVKQIIFYLAQQFQNFN